MATAANEIHDGWVAYHYHPSTAAAVIFMLLFIASTSLHTYQLLRTRTWFLIPLLIGGYFECVGYMGRLLSSTQSPNWTLGPYIMQSSLLLLAPALFAASVYMELGRLIMLVHGEKLSIIRVGWLTKLFVTGDVFSFLMQASGAGIMVKGADSQKTGENIIIGGLILQILYFGLFIVSGGIFQSRIRRGPTAQYHQLSSTWHKHMYALYATSLLILVRSIVRLVEFIQGSDGVIMRNETYIYVFDGMLMFAVLANFNVIHPSEINCLLGRGEKISKKGGLCYRQVEIPL